MTEEEEATDTAEKTEMATEEGGRTAGVSEIDCVIYGTTLEKLITAS